MLEKLFSPSSIAIIGASRTPGKVGYELVQNMIDTGYSGELVLVNPTASEILGVKCYPDLKSYGGSVELCVIAIATPLVKKAVDMSISAGAKAIVVITAGFKEVGEEGAQLEKEVLELCKNSRVRLLGPNCLGVINAYHKLNASFAKRMPEKGEISVISQSGALCTAILDTAASRHMGLAKLVSMGNKADLSEIDFLKYLATDDDSKVIVGYLENIVSGDEFVKAAETAAIKKPIIILKAGVTQAGAKAASSHTGGLAGADMAYGAAFKRSGVVRADTYEQLFDFATAFRMLPLPKGRRVAVITNAGGPGIMAADAIEQARLEIGTLGAGTATALRNNLPSAASVSNPIDVLGDADPDRYALAMKAALEDDSVDSIVVILTPQAMTKPTETARAIIRCNDKSKPVLVSFMGGGDVALGRDELVATGIPDYPSPERAVIALKAMCGYAEWLKRPARKVTRFPVNRNRVKRIINWHLRTNRLQVGEAQAKEILESYDFRVPKGKLVYDVEEAVAVSERLGFPVVMKIASPDIIHKSDLGGVKLNLTSANTVRDAYDLMMLRMKQKAPNAVIDGAYIEKMCSRGKEVILGMTRDPQFGPMLMFGLGGIFVEVLKDVTFYLAPITFDEAMVMLESTKSFALLKGVRGEASVDLATIATSLQRISQLVTDFPQIQEMDINPFIVGQHKEDSVAADARITLAAS